MFSSLTGDMCRKHSGMLVEKKKSCLIKMNGLTRIIFFIVFSTFGLSATSTKAQDKIAILTSGEQPGHYLQWNGKAILLIGDSVTQGWMEGGTNFDQTAYLDALASRGLNVVLIWTYIGTNAAHQQNDSRIGYDAPEIWPWQGSPDARNFDLRNFNQAYFDRLKEFVAYAQVKGIVVVITIQEGWTKTRFTDLHPFHSGVGNGPLTENSTFVELADYNNEMPTTYNSAWSRQQKNQYFQERFCDKLITELNSYTNVIFEMFNEGEWFDQNKRNLHEQHFLDFFSSRCTNLLLTNSDHITGDNPHNDAKVDIITDHGDWTGIFDEFSSEFNTSPAKPLLLSEPVPAWGGESDLLADLRHSVWEVALSGAGWVNQNDASFGWDPYMAMASKASIRNQAYDYAGYCAKFFNNNDVNFSGMKPVASLSSTGICLAKEGVEYVVYAPSGGSFSVNLNVATQPLDARWYNPSTGTFSEFSVVDGGASRTFTSPFSGDAVLHLKTSQETTQLVSGLNPSQYQRAYLNVGDTFYIDRAYTLASIPESLQNLLWLKTANEDKANTSDSFITFELSQAVYVKVGYDARITSIPGWLSSWDATDETIVDSGDVTYKVYSKLFSQGQVVLGGNFGPSEGSMYIVLIQPNTESDQEPPAAPTGLVAH